MVGVAHWTYEEYRRDQDAALRAPPPLDAAAAEAALAEAARRAQLGDPAGTRRLLALLEPLVRGTARRAATQARAAGLRGLVDFDDLTQQAQVALCRLIEQYDPAAGPALPYFTIRLRATMRRYVFRLARQRPAGRHLPAHTIEAAELVEKLTEQRHAEASGWARSGGEAALHEALGRLPPRVQRLLYLTYWQDVPLEAAAVRLRLSTTAAKRARLRALHRLREALQVAGLHE